jgi:hypothetical protein
MGVILWHRIGFEDQNVVISNDMLDGDLVLDADVRVEYGVGKAPAFQLGIPNLPLQTALALADAVESSPTGADGGIGVSVDLGYFDGGPQESAVKGRVDRIRTEEGPRPTTVLEGYEDAAFRLLNTTRSGTGGPLTSVSEEAPQLTVKQVVDAIVGPAQVQAAGVVTPPDVTFTSVSMVGENAFDLLEAFAGKVGAEVLIQEDQVQFGTGVTFPGAGGPPSVPSPAALDSLLSSGDTLVTIDPVGGAPLAEFKPLVLTPRPQARTAVRQPARESVQAFDFTVLGLPALRAGQLVIASVAQYADPFSPFRIVDVVHTYSRNSGYVCAGRAVHFDPMAAAGLNRQLTLAGRRATAASVVARLNARAETARVTHPSIDVGALRGAKHGKRVATFAYPQEPSSITATPSVDDEIGQTDAQVFDKPLLSPFAWHKVGLSVPLYPGMRALLAQRHDVREDAVAAGFLWANAPKSVMERPAAAEGDWWLCLPTELNGDGVPTGGGANDLVAKDGRRVIEAVSVNLRVGKKLLTPVGQRPAEVPADELLIEHASGTKVTIASDGAVTVDAQKAITLKSGSVTLTIGDGKVKVS